ncbi:hypothetical protein V5O48_018846 [Marasmius crinis-equi]|uniref:DUF6534 domain-containing protein n=1 Tax=Marasmius crinis-equi TaxID=585013 RepID=A0ABR3EK18_9AGAR
MEMVVMSTIITGASALCDVAISGVMIFYLQRSKRGVEKSTSMINRMILFTFSTGIPASTCAIMSLISEYAFPTTFLYLFFFLFCESSHIFTALASPDQRVLLGGRFYTNSLLISLNGRRYIVEGAFPQVGFNIPRDQLKGARRGGICKATTMPLVTLSLKTNNNQEKPGPDSDENANSTPESTNQV